jgi:hypothetical protein
VATLISSHQIEPGVFQETWEEDARIYHCYRDDAEHQRNSMRSELRKVHPKQGYDSPFRGVGYIAPHERHLLEWRNPALKSRDPKENYNAWKRFWQSSASERYRTVERV